VGRARLAADVPSPDVPLPDLLVERERELEHLSSRIDGAARGTGAVVMVEGEPGIGKSSLVAAATRIGTERGFEVLTARGHELESELPFGVVLQLFERRVVSAEAAERERLLDGAAALAAPLLTGGRPTANAPASVAHGLFWVTHALAEQRPLLLCVDDVHHADATSLRFLVYLAHRVAEVAVAVVAAYRPAEHGAADVLPVLRSHPATSVLRPRPLTEGGVGWVLAEHAYPGVDAEFVRACRRATGGNPLYLRELLSVLADQAIDATSAEIDRIGPRSVGDAVARAVGALHEGAARLAFAAAVLGHDVPLDDATALAGLTPDEGVASAAALTEAGILQRQARLTFTHPIARAALYERHTPVQRAQAHRDAARVLAGAGASADRIAAHLVLGDRAGDRWAADALVTAGRHALACGEMARAVQVLRRALDEPTGEVPPHEVLTDLARAESAAGEPSALARFETARRAAPHEAARARTCLHAGRALLSAGRFAEAAEWLARGRGDAPTGDPVAEELESAWLNAALWLPEYGSTVLERHAAEVTSRTALRLEDRRVLANLAGAALFSLDRERAVALARRAWGDGALLDEAGPDEPALYGLTAPLLQADLLDEAQVVLEAVVDAVTTAGLLPALAPAAYSRAGMHLVRLQTTEAVADLELAAEGRRAGGWLHAAAAACIETLTRRARGDIAGASGAVRFDAETEARLTAGADFLAVESARAWLALDAGDAAAAAAAARRSEALARAVRWDAPSPFNWRPPLVRALAAIGDAAEARAVAGEELEIARRWGAPSGIVSALRSVAAADPDVGVEALREAADISTGSPALYERAHALTELGLALRAAGTAVERGRRCARPSTSPRPAEPARWRRRAHRARRRRRPPPAPAHAGRLGAYAGGAARRDPRRHRTDESRDRRGALRHRPRRQMAPRQRVSQARRDRPRGTRRRVRRAAAGRRVTETLYPGPGPTG
jgi:tetratricopeptide (TPR) repeat protein